MKPNHFTSLLISLLIILVVAPIVTERLGAANQSVISILFALAFLISAWRPLAQGKWFILSIVLSFSGLATASLHSFFYVEAYHLAMLGILLTFCGLSITVALRQVLFRKSIGSNELVGSVCIYLLFGLIWAILYTLVQLAIPESFDGLADTGPGVTILSFVYFSFVTLTTLGYGDITPANTIAGTLAYLEAVFGQFYFALLVASLVGAHMSGGQRETKITDHGS